MLETSKQLMIFFAPISNGWRVFIRKNLGVRIQEAGSLGDLVGVFSSWAKVRKKTYLALPAKWIVLERLTLPSNDPLELRDMVRLQLEKTLPYPIEEATVGFQIIPRTGLAVSLEEKPGVTVIACALHHPAAESLCTLLLMRRQFPEALTIWGMHLAEQAGAAIACALWQEGEEVVFATFENGILSFVEIIASVEDVIAELPKVLITAELAGAPAHYEKGLLDPALAHFQQQLNRILGVSFIPLVLDSFPKTGILGSGTKAQDFGSAHPVDLTPPRWRAEMAKEAAAKRFTKHMVVAGGVYLGLLLVVFAYVQFMQHRLDGLQKKLALAQPQLDVILQQQQRWKAFEPIVEQNRGAVELLYQVFMSLPSPEVRITLFESTPSQITIEGEAPDPSLAIQLGEKLKAAPELKDFLFEQEPPVILPNEHAQFRIFGKL